MSTRITLIALIFIGLVFYSCKGTKKTTETKQNMRPSADEISFYDKSIDSFATDHFEIDSISINEQTLFVYVSYSGGCGEVEFEMFYKPQVLTVMPHRNTLLIRFTDNDPCRELIQKRLIYDLSIFNKEAKSGGVVFNLDKYEFIYTISEE